MTLGITRVRTSYDIVDDECLMYTEVGYTVEVAGWYLIGACIPRTSDCYMFCNPFEVEVGDPISGERDMFVIHVGGDFWQPGDKIDVTLSPKALTKGLLPIYHGVLKITDKLIVTGFLATAEKTDKPGVSLFPPSEVA